jgi:DNA-binding phage protein
MSKPLGLQDVIRLLHRQVKAAGSQAAWCRKTGVSRENLNRVLRGRLSPTKSIINALDFA